MALALLTAPASDQVLLVVTPTWDTPEGRAWLFEDGEAVMGPMTAHVGHAGLAWGRGLRNTPDAPQKREGDGRAPAGIFRIGAIWRAPQTRFSHCVDDASSADYGRIVEHPVGKAHWKSAEAMEMYRVAIVVEHNDAHVRGAGSCIFLHDGSEPTLGCTAFAPDRVDELARRLRSGARLVQLPEAEYRRRRSRWKLPRVIVGR